MSTFFRSTFSVTMFLPCFSVLFRSTFCCFLCFSVILRSTFTVTMFLPRSFCCLFYVLCFSVVVRSTSMVLRSCFSVPFYVFAIFLLHFSIPFCFCFSVVLRSTFAVTNDVPSTFFRSVPKFCVLRFYLHFSVPSYVFVFLFSVVLHSTFTVVCYQCPFNVPSTFFHSAFLFFHSVESVPFYISTFFRSVPFYVPFYVFVSPFRSVLRFCFSVLRFSVLNTN